MKSASRKIATLTILGIAAVISASVFLVMPPLMQPPERTNVQLSVAQQDLSELFRHLKIFQEQNEGRLPVSLEELRGHTGYLTRLTTDALSRKLERIEFPLRQAQTVRRKEVIARMTLDDSHFYLLSDGHVHFGANNPDAEALEP